MSNKKLTPRGINENLEHRKIKCLIYYGNVKDKSFFQCEKLHVWVASLNSVKNGSGCPHCSGKVKLTVSKINSFLENRGVKCLSYKGNVLLKSEFTCNNGHIWSATVNSVKAGNGCPFCASRNKLTINDINNDLKSRKIKCVALKGNVNQISDFTCDNGHVWSAKTADIRSGHGCPFCSVSGFKPDEKACVYILTDSITSPSLVKIGVTNDADKRITILKNKTPFSVYEVLRFDFKTGKEAYDFEQHCHYCLAIFNACLTGFDGCTEWFLYNDNLLEWVKNESKTLSTRRNK